MRILSIDWDYFIDASLAIRGAYFPDGGNEGLSLALSNFIWASRYSDYPAMKAIQPDKKAIVHLRILLQKTITKDTKVMIADSHRHAYNFILKSNKGHSPVELYNIDFHHDVYNNGGDELNCGNWLKCLKPCLDNNANMYWVKREDSDTELAEGLMETNLREIPDEEPFDVVFLCRSSCWSPPHLDKDFILLAKAIMRRAAISNTRVIEDVMSSRWNKSMRAAVEENIKVREMMRENMKGSN